MNLVQRLIEADRKKQARILIVGDAMRDLYHHGRLQIGQEGCPKFVSERTIEVAGGSSNAERSLNHWNARCIGVHTPFDQRSIKSRYLVDGKCVFRHDADIPYRAHGREHDDIAKMIANLQPQAVLISDYDKGYLSGQTIRNIIDDCNARKIPVVCDAKRKPDVYDGSILKCNQDYASEQSTIICPEKTVITRGSNIPRVKNGSISSEICKPIPAVCINHVGAGDCFAAHMTLALAHGFALEEAATIAYAAGSVYVGHHHNRPPCPHEISKALDPIGGKVITADDLPDMIKQTVFTNGVFRMPHAGHSWLLRWAKAQGETLIVGINDDASAKRLRPHQFILPLSERIEMLAAMKCVDYIVPFSEDTPERICHRLCPDVMVKGHEYQGMKVPGSDHATELRFAPAGPFEYRSATSVESEIFGSKQEFLYGS